MEIILTFEGHIPSGKSKEKVCAMRRSFHSQLSKLWGKHPFDSLVGNGRSSTPEGEPRYIRKIGDREFAPFYGESVGIAVDLDILLLTGVHGQKPVIYAGDLDNRFKRIIDALRAPQSENEITKGSPLTRQFTLLEDDNVVAKISARLGSNLRCDDPKLSLAIITVRPIAWRADLKNMAMLF